MDNNLKYKRYNNFKLLKQFLIDNDCYHSYMFNVIKSNPDIISCVLQYITSKSVYSYINAVFAWCFTKEGYDYWYNIDIKWKGFICKPYIKT